MGIQPTIHGYMLSGMMPPFKRPLRDRIRTDQKTMTRRLHGLEKVNKGTDGLKAAYQDGGGSWIFWDHDEPGLAEFTKEAYPNGVGLRCQYQPGQYRALREPLRRMGDFAMYADGEDPVVNALTGRLLRWEWKVNTLSQLFMPYEATRTICRIVGHRPERLQDISEEDAYWEGSDPVDGLGLMEPRLCYKRGFMALWDSINGKKYPWVSNPWLWAITFERVR